MSLHAYPWFLAPTLLRIKEIKNEISLDLPIEVFPNLIVNIINEKKIALCIHHIINKKISGVIHLGSKDLIHHVDLVKGLYKWCASSINKTPYKFLFTNDPSDTLKIS